jgi:two-component system phosphate regulon sensor histidine kinase PhoR
VEHRSTSRIAWAEPRLDPKRRQALAQSLEAVVKVGAGRCGWLLGKNGPRVELLACVGPLKPHRTCWSVKLPNQAGCLSPDRISELSPFHKSVRDFKSLRFYPLLNGGLVLEGTLEPPARLLTELQLQWELMVALRETAGLRKKVQRLSQELKDTRQASARLRPALEQGERRAEALSLWYRQASEMLTSTQLRSRLPRLARQAQQLLEVDASAILVKETERVRVWGGGIELPGSMEIDDLGPLGRRVLEGGQVYRYQRSSRRQDKFFDNLGLASVLCLPLEIEGRILGGIFFGHSGTHRFTPDEIDLARLTAYQSALFLENTLLVTGSDVERVVARAVLESMADGVFTLDWEKKITSFNPAAEQITGWRMEEAIGRSCKEVMQSRYLCAGAEKPGSCDEHCPLLTLLANQELMERGLTVEGSITNRQGETRYVSSTYSVVADRGDLLGAVVLFRDITERRRLEEMKSEYAAALTHDLKTPLTAMKGYAVTLLRHGHRLNEESRKEALEVINFEIDRVCRMFDNLLHQARLEAGVKQQNLSTVRPHKVIKQVVALYAYSGRSHELICEVEPEDLELVTDRDQLDQILNNLVSNALKYTPGGSKVWVRCRSDEQAGMLLFEVVDNGPGISEEELPLVFNRFHRVAGANSGKARGTGLGLHITRMLVESLGGETGVSSELGKGSRFWFRLPVHPSGAALAAKGEEQ